MDCFLNLKKMEQNNEKITRDNITKHLLVYQLEMVGKTLLDTLDEEEWYKVFTMTALQKEEFDKYAMALIRKIFKCNKKKAIDTLQWFDLGYGLAIKG